MARRKNFVVWTVFGTLLSLVFPVLGAVIAGLLFPEFRLTQHSLHALLESSGGLISLCIAGILIAELGQRADTNHYPWMAAGFASMGVLDLFHAASQPGNHFVWLRSLATLTGGVCFGLLWISVGSTRSVHRRHAPEIAALLATLVGAASILFPNLLPMMRSPDGAFSNVALALNVSGGIGFLVACLFFIQRFRRTAEIENWLFGVLTALFGAAGLLFAYSNVWDGAWWWWHFLRLVAYVAALLYGMQTFRHAEKKLQQVNLQLSQANNTLDRDRALLQAIHAAQTQFITVDSPVAVFNEFLIQIQALAESEYGFIDEMFYTTEGQPVLTARAITDISWSDESRGMYQQFIDGTLSFTNLKSLYGEVMTSGRALIANDAPNDPRRTELPPGHPIIQSFLGLPMMSRTQEFVGVIGLANRPGGYSEEVIQYLQPMVSACANMITARKNAQRRRDADIKVQQLNEQLNATNVALDRIVEERTAKLLAIEERFELAVRGSTDGLWDWCVPTSEVYYSPRMKELLGYTDDEFPNVFESFESRLHPDDHGRVMLDVQNHIKEHKPYDVKYRLQTKHDGYRWFRSRGQALWNEAGVPLRMAGSITDVTEEHRLRERFRLAVEASPAALMMVQKDGQILMANSRSLSLFGYTEEELIGQVIEILVPDRFRAQHPANRSKFFQDPIQRVMGAELDLLAVRKDGSEFPVKVGLSPVLTAEGQAVICGVMDITDQKRTMEAMRQAKEAAESASRAKSSFLANMSHEIRTPMNGIIGMAQLLAQTELRPHQRDYLATMNESAHILLRLLNDILDFSKIEAGKLELECLDFRISDCVARATQMLVLRAAEKRLEIACRVAPDIPDHLRGDSGRLQQVLVNLLGNAVKFTELGEILVNVNMESVTSETIRLRISVSDTGIGIPPDKLDHIFRPFEQAESSTTRRFGGTGLGLTISQQLVSMMHGRIWIDSEVGRGSTFHFTAEFGIAADQHRPEPADLDSLHKLPVLVVDDNLTNRRILGEILKHWHMQPIMAESAAAGRRALQKASEAQRPIRLILLDHHMPDEDGFRFAESLDGLINRGECPIIMISSGTSPVDTDLGQKYGISRFMTKPVIASELLNEMLRQFGQHTTAKHQKVVPATPLLQTHSRRILLVEDNEINRRVALAMLTKRGHEVVVCENGQVAIHTLNEQEFDVVLMDMQMPVMDGYAATAAIRSRERETGAHLPIVAMTAEALKGDRERCLAAGMDDYVSKPITPAEMYRAVERFPALCLSSNLLPPTMEVGDTDSNDVEQVHLPTFPDDTAEITDGVVPAVDWSVAKARLGNDMDVLREFAQLVRKQAPTLLADLRISIETEDVKLLRRSAHTLKGSVSYFGAEPLAQAALALEILGRIESFDNSRELLAVVENELSRMQTALDIGPPWEILPG